MHVLFGCGVQGGGSFIKDQYFRVAVKRAGNGDALLLPTRKRSAIFAKISVEAGWKFFYKI